ncbi:hypothetical protein IQ249_07215 [Lusitaniella coriacea LEGE 07157]|uniref:Lipoprotein n=1 Tax=Lusitaniella coriacea LEGE 07157 TaxID=945747 RepID=A0A8J7IRC6_9CYAN|nr:hypothetical protein [Lusitaniella coriacea]MBE9115682.1 hypothetical protein [Lusitaniella coriacea LEGE 07157]
MKNRIGQTAIALIFLGMTFGCTSEQTPSNNAITSQASSDPITATASASTARPVQKTANLSIEGETEEITLTLYNEPTAPFTTYFPSESFVTESGCSGEGCGYRFLAKTETGEANDAAYLHFFFPSNSQTAEEMEQSYVEDVLSSNNWERIPIQESDSFYPWAKRVIHFSSADAQSLGQIIIGEVQGKGFGVIEFMEVEYAEGFTPRFAAIYENLEFNED